MPVLALSTNDQTLTLSQSDEGLRLSIALSGRELLNVSYAAFSPFSFTRPWSIEPAQWAEIRCWGEGDALHVEGLTHRGIALHDRFTVAHGMFRVERCWDYRGAAPVADVALGTSIPSGVGGCEKITIPHVLYNDNPSADPERVVPHLPKRRGYALVVEEHRLPIPSVNVEWRADIGFVALSVFTVPSAVALPGADDDHWWTLGGIHQADHVDVVSLSGVAAFNNEKDKVYGAQRTALDYPRGYLRLAPGDTVEKTLFIGLHRCASEGLGFRVLPRKGFAILQPLSEPALSLDETIELKMNALRSRWRKANGLAGFSYLPDTEAEGNVYRVAPAFQFGWTGQSLRLAWSALAYGRAFDDPAAVDMGRRVLDAFARAPRSDAELGLCCCYYVIDKDQWGDDQSGRRDRFNARKIGEAHANLADCIALLQDEGLAVEDRWAEPLRRACDFLCQPKSLLPDGAFPLFFTPDGRPAEELVAAGGAPCVVALLAAGEVLGQQRYVACGIERLRSYHDLFARTFERPFARATLDAACEDKEAGLYFFLAAYRAWRITGDGEFEDMARTAAEWVATFTYQWDVPMRPDTPCGRNGFRSAFWPGVSVQNMHLDVFATPFETWDFGRRAGDELLERLGLGTMKAWTHGIAQRPGHWGFPTPGEQAEQFNHTNYYQGRGVSVADWRGGVNRWNPSWIVGLVLQAALRFRRAGVEF